MWLRVRLSDMDSVFKKSKSEHRQGENYMKKIEEVQSQRIQLQHSSQIWGSGLIAEQEQKDCKIQRKGLSSERLCLRKTSEASAIQSHQQHRLSKDTGRQAKVHREELRRP